MVWDKCTEEKRQPFKEYGQEPYEKNKENGNKQWLTLSISDASYDTIFQQVQAEDFKHSYVSMGIQRAQYTTVKGTGSSFPTRPAVRAIATLNDIAAIRIIWFHETGDAVEV